MPPWSPCWPIRTTLLLAVAAATATAQAPHLHGARPNILFVFSDDHAEHAISAYGSKLIATPSIDRIAQTGALFRSNFCGNGICGPSRATILTGKHSHENGFMRNGNVFDGGQTTFPQLLQQAGYETALVGKWHLESIPTGFDHWSVLPGQGQYYNPEFMDDQGRTQVDGHVTDIVTDKAIDFLEHRDAQKPFLLMCQHKAPHRPWQPAPEDLLLFADETIQEPPTLFDDYAGRAGPAHHTEMRVAEDLLLHYDLMLPPTEQERGKLKGDDAAYEPMMRRMRPDQRTAWNAAFAKENAAFLAAPPTGDALVRWKYQRYIKNYLRCVAGVDRSVGRLFAWLDAHPDVAANTLVIYSSDQGFFLGEHGWFDKRWMYEESLHMPLLMSWPGHIEAGREITALTQNIDFAPTFLDLAGVAVPTAVQGRSLVPLLEDPAAKWRSSIYYHYYESQATHMVAAHYGIRTDRYKLIRYYEPQWDTWELFDLQQDPDEVRDLAGDPAHRELKQQLAAQLEELRRQYGDTTGQLGGAAWPIVAGIARVERGEHGPRVWSNATGGYLLREGSRTGKTVFTTTMRPVAGRPATNGYIAATGGNARRDLVRAGVAFGARKLLITGVGELKERATIGIDWDGSTPIELRVTFDLDSHRVVAEASGQRIEMPLPPEWIALTAWGFSLHNAETEFSDLEIR